ncbi:MAG: SHOCT domain-containing protein [Arhodomonas sp.]|nr:SHOCT domain-containing protein [Arhodomonas sp.]
MIGSRERLSGHGMGESEMRGPGKGYLRLAAIGLVTGVLGGCAGVAPPPEAEQEAAPGVVPAIETLWSAPERGWVRRVAAEAEGGGYRHPVQLDAQWLRQALYNLRLRPDDEDKRKVRLFDAADLDLLVPGLVRGLAEAGPEEAVAIAVAGRRGGFTFFDPVRLTTFRAFVDERGLNLLFGALDQALPRGETAAYLERAPVGTREGVLIEDDRVWSRGWGASTPREDWVVLPVETADGALPEFPEVGAGAEGGEAADTGDAGSRGAAAGDNAVPVTIRERLERLEDLHDDGLITDEEYEAKRAEILEEL